MTEDSSSTALQVLTEVQWVAEAAECTRRELYERVEAQRTHAVAHHFVGHDYEFFPSDPSSGGPFYRQPPHHRLLPHQQEGVRWLQALHESHLHGILADEMGLGKTIQVIAFFSALATRGIFGTFLIVAPLSTLENWRREVHRWVPWMSVTVFHGQADVRTRLRAKLRRRHRRAFQLQEQLREQWQNGVSVQDVAKEVGGVVLASYESVMLEQGALVRLLPWDVVTVDEAHRLKNLDCKLLRTLRKADESMRLILTGTPLQNNLDELWTLLEYVAPQLFSHLSTTQQDARTAMALAVADSNTSMKSDTNAEVAFANCFFASEPTPSRTNGHRLVDYLTMALQAFMLRRTKRTAGIHLPPKYDLFVPTPLTEPQSAFYVRVSVEGRYALGRLTHLRKCCMHPFLFPEYQDKVFTEQTFSKGGEQMSVKEELELLLRHSGKLQLLDRMLPELRRRGHRVLLFSQMTKALDLAENYLRLKNQLVEEEMAEASGNIAEVWTRMLPYTRLDGSSTAAERIDAIRCFQPADGAAGLDAVISEGREETKRGQGDSSDSHGVSTTASVARAIKKMRSPSSRGECTGVAADNALFDEREVCDASVPSPSPPFKKRKDESAFLSERSLNELVADGAPTLKRTMKPSYANLSRSTSTPQLLAPVNTEALQPLNGLCGDSEYGSSEPGRPTASSAFLPALPSPQLFLFLVSTRAGGAGLNLTGADTVILLDGDFNPHNDAQAVDRCHRIGQRKPVAVYRLVSPHTVEDEKQLRIVLRKLKLSRLVLGEEREDKDDAISVAGGQHIRAPVQALELLDTINRGSKRAQGRKRVNKEESVEREGHGLTAEELDHLLDRTWLQQTCPPIL